MPIVIGMGWLWNETHHLFDVDDGSFPEICICGLSADQVSSAYSFIRKIADFIVGGPRFFNCKTNCEMGLDEVENAARLVCEKKANPFHFMTRSLRYADGRVNELGVFILDNAVALDYEKGPIWGEREIETLLHIILHIKSASPQAFLRFEETVRDCDRQTIENAISRLATT